MPTNNQVHIKEVRCAFPKLFEKATFKGEEKKYEVTLLIPKGKKKTHKKIMDAMTLAVKESGLKVSKSKYHIRDGDDEDITREEYKGHWTLKASTPRKPTVIDRNKDRLDKDDDRPYSGCYLNAIVSFRVYDVDGSKGVSATLHGVQFVKDGDSIGGPPIASVDDFEDLGDDEDDEDNGMDDEDEVPSLDEDDE